MTVQPWEVLHVKVQADPYMKNATKKQHTVTHVCMDAADCIAHFDTLFGCVYSLHLRTVSSLAHSCHLHSLSHDIII